MLYSDHSAWSFLSRGAGARGGFIHAPAAALPSRVAAHTPSPLSSANAAA
jgi:hypothetical protein